MNADPGPIPKFLDRAKQKPLVGSYSLLSQYMNCPHAAFHKYVAKTYPYVETPAMVEGNAIHLAMENRLRIKQPLPPKYAQWESFAVPFDGYHDDTRAHGVPRQALGVELKRKSHDLPNARLAIFRCFLFPRPCLGRCPRTRAPQGREDAQGVAGERRASEGDCAMIGQISIRRLCQEAFRESLSPERRKEIATAAAKARWG